MQQLIEIKLKNAGYCLSNTELLAFEIVVNQLKKWNKTVNLTSIISDNDIINKHIIDSLIVVKHLNNGESLVDVGSGAGFPIFPIKIMHKDILVTSVDAVQKKIMFQKHLARMLLLEQFITMHTRIEDLYESHKSCFDVAVSRAFSSIIMFVSLVAPLIKKGGRIIAMKGPDGLQEMKTSANSIKMLGFEMYQHEEYHLPDKSGTRTLIMLKSVK